MPATEHAKILLKVAQQTLIDARRLWRAAKTSEEMYAAFRACLLASRSNRKAAAEWSTIDDAIAQKCRDDADRIDDAVTDLLATGVLDDVDGAAVATT